MKDYNKSDMKKKTISLKNYSFRNQKVTKTAAMTAKLKEYLNLKEESLKLYKRKSKLVPFKVLSHQDHINACRSYPKYRQESYKEEILANKALIAFYQLESLIIRSLKDPNGQKNISSNKSAISRLESRIEDLSVESSRVIGIISI